MKPSTFRGRLGILLVASVMTPILLIGFSSFQWMSVVQKTKIDEDLSSSVKLEMEAIERGWPT